MNYSLHYVGSVLPRVLDYCCVESLTLNILLPPRADHGGAPVEGSRSVEPSNTTIAWHSIKRNMTTLLVTRIIELSPP